MKIYPSFSKIVERKSLEDGDIPLGYVSVNNLTPTVKVEEVNSISVTGDIYEELTPYSVIDTKKELLFDMNGNASPMKNISEKSGDVEYLKAGIVKEFTPETFDIIVNSKRANSYSNSKLLPLRIGIIESGKNEIAKKLVTITGDGGRRGVIPPALRINNEDTNYTSFYDFELEDLDILIIESHDGVHYAETNEIIDFGELTRNHINVWVVATEMEDAMLPVVIDEERYESEPYPEVVKISNVKYVAPSNVAPDHPIENHELKSDLYNNGFDAGYRYGYEKAFIAYHLPGFLETDEYSYREGTVTGYEEGLIAGEEEGFRLGYDKGFIDQNKNEWNYEKTLADVEEIPEHEEIIAEKATPYYKLTNTTAGTGVLQNPITGASGDFLEGAKDGYDEGYHLGKELGYDAGRFLIEEISYQAGYDLYYLTGYIEGKKNGFEKGYETGRSTAISKNEIDGISMSIKNPFYYKKERIVFDDIKFVWSAHALLEKINKDNTMEPRFLFDKDSPVATVEDMQGAYVMYFESTIFQEPMKYRLLLSEMMLYIALMGYAVTEKKKFWLTDNRVSYLLNTRNVLGDTQPEIIIHELLEEGSSKDEVLTTNPNIVFDAFTSKGGLRFKKLNRTDPDPENLPSIYTPTGTVVYYEPRLQRIETKLDYAMKEMASSVQFSFAPIKSSGLKLDISRQTVSVPKIDDTYFICANTSNLTVVPKSQIERNDIALIRVEVSSKRQVKLFDASIPGGGLPEKLPDNYNVLDIASLQGRPYRRASGVIMTLPKDLKPFHEDILVEIDKHKAAAEVVKIRYE